MTTFLAVLGALGSVFGILKLLDKWFTKPVEQKVEDDQKSVADDTQKFKDTGRPPQ